MLGWLPIVGPIIDGIISIWKGYQNVDVQKYTVDGKVDITAIQASTQVITDFKDDIGVRLCRDLILFPVSVWAGLIGWDNIVVYEFPNLFLKVAAFPPGLAYLPYAVLVFLFGAQALRKWK